MAEYWIIFDTEAEAKHISHLFYMLTIEGQIKKDADWLMYGVFPLAQDKYGLWVHTDFKFKIHPDANIQTLIDVYKTKDEITKQEETNIKTFVSSDKWAVFDNFVTDAIRSKFLTVEQMQAAGYFTETVKKI